MIKIFVLASHSFKERTSGVDFVRLIQPMRYLSEYKDFDITIFDPRNMESFDWRDVFRVHDIVYFNYTTNDIGYAVMGLMAQKYKKKLICDLDDNLWDILPDNTAYEIFKKKSQGLGIVTAILNDVHYVTTTSSYLKNVIAHNTFKTHDKIQVFPNYIDLDLYTHRNKFKDRGYYVGLHFGSTTHFNSLYSKEFSEAMDKVMNEYPNFTFMTVGAFLPQYRKRWGTRYKQGFGDIDIFNWIEKMPEFTNDADFMIVPLMNNVYNRSKSSIKYLEASTAKLPGCYQDIRQYQELIKDGENGFLCESTDKWYESITMLINNAKLRKEMGENAFKTIKSWDVKKHIKEYADYFKKNLTIIEK